MNEQLIVSGTISDKTYQSLRKVLTPPIYKIILLCLLGVYLVSMLWTIVAQQNWANLLLVVIFVPLLFFCYFQGQKSNVKRIIKGHPELTNGGFRVVIRFGEENIHLQNLTRGSERTLAYSLIKTMYESENCIALFTKSNFMMVPTEEVSAEQKRKIVEKVMAKNPKIGKRW